MDLHHTFRSEHRCCAAAILLMRSSWLFTLPFSPLLSSLFSSLLSSLLYCITTCHSSTSTTTVDLQFLFARCVYHPYLRVFNIPHSLVGLFTIHDIISNTVDIRYLQHSATYHCCPGANCCDVVFTMWIASLIIWALSSLPSPARSGPVTSPPYYPSPWGSGSAEWADAYIKARAFVKQLTLLEKVNLTTGVG